MHLQRLVPPTSCQDKLAGVGCWNVPMWVRDSNCKPPPLHAHKDFPMCWHLGSQVVFLSIATIRCFLGRVSSCFGFLSTEVIQRTLVLEHLWCDQILHSISAFPGLYETSIRLRYSWLQMCFFTDPGTTFPANITRLSSLFFLIFKKCIAPHVRLLL